MLVFGKAQYLNDFKKQFPKSELVVFNFSFIGEGYEILDLLPRERFNIDDSQEFDIAYDISFVLSFRFGLKKFNKLLLPAPDCPVNTVILFLNRLINLSFD